MGRRIICVWAAVTTVLGGCQPPPPVARPVSPQVAPPRPPGPVAAGEREEVRITMDAGATGELGMDLLTASADATKGVTVTDLAPAETAALLARLEPLPAVASAHAPVVRPATAMPPGPGTIQPIAFVAPTGATIGDKPLAHIPLAPPALEAPQILPVGNVPAESEVRVRFAETMVAVEKLGATPANVATISPPVAGTWKWLDTRVAAFTPTAPRLAQATPYTVTVKAGTKALSGALLASDVTGTFTTPDVTFTGTYPYGSRPVRPDAPIALTFDQDIDPAALLPFLTVTRDKAKKPIAITTTTLDAARLLWAKNPSFEIDLKQLGAHSMVIAPASGAWPAGIKLDVTLGKGAPSREGPRLTERPLTRSFVTAAPFVAKGIDCGYATGAKLATTCPARSLVEVQFSNPLDEKAFRPSMISVEGETPTDHIARGNQTTVQLPALEGHTYTVRLADALHDAYGQPLVGAHAVKITTTRFVYRPYLFASDGLYVLDPRFQIPQWVVQSQAVKSLHVELYKVEPADYFAWSVWQTNAKKPAPGKRISARDYPVGDRYAGIARVDLRPALDASGVGHVVAVVTAAPSVPLQRYDGFQPRYAAWIEVTKLGISARVDQARVHAWVNAIAPAQFLEPRAGVTTSLIVENRRDLEVTAKTDAEGAATFELPPAPAKPKYAPSAPQEDQALLVARAGADSAFTAIDRAHRTERVRNAQWYVTDDRFMYKPGEPVYVKGWVRWTHDGVNPGLELPARGDTLAYSVFDARNNKIVEGKAELTDQGGFDLQFDLPQNANLGYASIHLATKGQEITHEIQVQEFRTPVYGVNLTEDVRAAGAKPLYLGEALEMNAEAKYYAGGGLPGAGIKWEARLQAASYRPPGWQSYTFEPGRAKRSESGLAYDQSTAAQSTTLGGGSTSLVKFGIHALPQGLPSVLSVDATVTDVDRQTIRASSSGVIVHPATYYVGMRLAPDTTDQVQLVATDVDGNAIAGVPIDVTFEATMYSDARHDDAKVYDTQHCAVKSELQPVVCVLKRARTPQDLLYRAVATVVDKRGRTNTTQYYVPWYRWPDAKDTLSIVPDKPKYRAGETAQLQIRSDVVPATAIVSYARQGVIVQHRLALADKVTKLSLPMDVGYLENVHVQVDRMAKRETDDQNSTEPLPEQNTAEVDLRVDLDASRLQLRARPTRPLVQPGEEATFEVDVQRADKPVANAEVALIVVDEAVLALTGMHHPDPLAPFYREVEAGTSEAGTLGMVEDADQHLKGVPGFDRIDLDTSFSGFISGSGGGTGFGTLGYGSGSGMGHGMGTSVVTARKDFRATAVFAPKLHTDARGHVSVTVKMPESMTRFRVVALATAETYFFGKGEGTIVTQRKVNARTQAPRFLSQGDRFELPVVVQNLDRTPRTIDVAVRAANLSGGGGKRVVVPAGQRAEVRFPLATVARGKAVIQTIVQSGTFTDASNVEVPVYEPATTESFATYGIVDGPPAYEQLKVPGEIFADVGGVETEVASTQLQGLTDAYGYLQQYPYECAEQRSSRMLATLAFNDVLDAFAAPGRPSPQELRDVQRHDIGELASMENDDGGWGYWRDTPTDAFVSMQVLTALSRLGEKGTPVKRGTAYVQKLLRETTAKLDQAKRGDAVGYQVSLAATALTALAATGLDERPAAVRLDAVARRIEIYPVDAKARLLALLARGDGNRVTRAKLLAELLSAAHETAAGASVATSYTEGDRLLLASDQRTNALVLDAMIREDANQPLIEKLARGLLNARSHGHWRSTQENLAVLEAMRRYFDTYEKAVPNYTGKLWVGNVAYAQQVFAGRSNLRAQAQLDWKQLAPGTTHDVALQKDGPGRMYYRIGITYAPKKIDLPALDAGFVVRREYHAIDNPSDVAKTADGVRIKLGARVEVVVEAVAPMQRDNVALVDPLPAGLEAVNTNLATAERAVKSTTSYAWNHLEMRDNRSEAFARWLPAGVHRFTYTARATVPGTFMAAPAKAEEMYSPETFGRSTGVKVVVY